MFSILLIILLLTKPSENFSLSFDSCLASSNCGPTEYCDRDLPNPIGVCKPGYLGGRACFRDRVCASKKCTFFVCENRDKIRDGQCDKKLKNTDCPTDQYCKQIDGEYKCANRKCLGFCRKDSQCISNQCHLFTCVKSKEPC